MKQNLIDTISKHFKLYVGACYFASCVVLYGYFGLRLYADIVLGVEHLTVLSMLDVVLVFFIFIPFLALFGVLFAIIITGIPYVLIACGVRLLRAYSKRSYAIAGSLVVTLPYVILVCIYIADNNKIDPDPHFPVYIVFTLPYFFLLTAVESDYSTMLLSINGVMMLCVGAVIGIFYKYLEESHHRRQVIQRKSPSIPLFMERYIQLGIENTTITSEFSHLVGGGTWENVSPVIKKKIHRLRNVDMSLKLNGCLDKVHCSRVGMIFSSVVRLFGNPIIAKNVKDIPTQLTFSIANNTVMVEQKYHLPRQGEMFRKVKQYVDCHLGVIIQLGFGLQLVLDVVEEHGALHFRSFQYRLFYLPLPSFLTPGVVDLVISDGGQQGILFKLECMHSIFGQTYFQEGSFR